MIVLMMATYRLVTFSAAAPVNERVSRDLFDHSGDEFAILIPHLNDEQAAQLTKRIQRSMTAESVEGLPISVSCGWGTKTKSQERITDVVKCEVTDRARAFAVS